MKGNAETIDDSMNEGARLHAVGAPDSENGVGILSAAEERAWQEMTSSRGLLGALAIEQGAPFFLGTPVSEQEVTIGVDAMMTGGTSDIGQDNS